MIASQHRKGPRSPGSECSYFHLMRPVAPSTANTLFWLAVTYSVPLTAMAWLSCASFTPKDKFHTGTSLSMLSRLICPSWLKRVAS